MMSTTSIATRRLMGSVCALAMAATLTACGSSVNDTEKPDGTSSSSEVSQPSPAPHSSEAAADREVDGVVLADFEAIPDKLGELTRESSQRITPATLAMAYHNGVATSQEAADAAVFIGFPPGKDGTFEPVSQKQQAAELKAYREQLAEKSPELDESSTISSNGIKFECQGGKLTASFLTNCATIVAGRLVEVQMRDYTSSKETYEDNLHAVLDDLATGLESVTQK